MVTNFRGIMAPSQRHFFLAKIKLAFFANDMAEDPLRNRRGRWIIAALHFGPVMARSIVSRHIRLLAPLAFIPPSVLEGIINSTLSNVTVTALAKTIPYHWPKPIPFLVAPAQPALKAPQPMSAFGGRTSARTPGMSALTHCDVSAASICCATKQS